MSTIEHASLFERDFLPGQIPEVDEDTRRALAQLILDETIEIPTPNRGTLVTYGDLSDTEFIKLYQPLVDILQLDPAKDRPPLREHFDRASRLGLVPSTSPIYSRMNLSRVHTELGFRAKFRFDDWMIADYVKAGQRLARRVNGRPTRFDIAAGASGHYARLGDFPTIDNLKSRFGKLSVFHELIGYPSCKGWLEDDYYDWAAAFYIQNPGVELSARKIEKLSAAGRGPSKQPIIKRFDSIGNFKQLSQEEFRQRQAMEDMERNERLSQAEELAIQNPQLLDILSTVAGDQSRILQITGQFRLAQKLAPQTPPAKILKAAAIESPSSFVHWCMNQSNPPVKAADVETYAAILGVFDDLWPMYRFQNVDLAI